MTIALPPGGTPAWYVRDEALAGGRWRVRCILSTDEPDGAVVGPEAETEGRYVHWSASLDAQGRPNLRINPLSLGDVPALWFVEVPESEAPEPATSLVAFVGDLQPPGTVVSNAVFFTLPVKSEDQVGAVRWYIDDGTVDQVFVSQAWRRRGVGSALLYSADCFHQFSGWSGSLHTDGRRTALGESLMATLRFPERIAPLEELVRPMDPPEENSPE